jgi:molybdopterin-biosynthesis enzyme MoeA-like protein
MTLQTPIGRSAEPADLSATAAFLLIGNELLSGKVAEANLQPLAQLLRRRGIALQRVVAVADDEHAIATEIADLSRRFTWVFTSGGVGPTHDDVTIDGVARGFGVTVTLAPELVAMLRAHYGERLTDERLRMAKVPDTAELLVAGDIVWPTVRMRNVWILPGIPEVFRMKLAVVAAHLPEHAAFISRAVYTKIEESTLVALIDATVAAFADVEIGSYPKWFDDTYKTKVTFDGRDPARLESALRHFVALLPEGGIVRIDEQPSFELAPKNF